ncbi:uncharacterized protein IWZ02DRAFT_236112 [Phyllosticta citriasiana]|uniref:uncharacterized protein n=1 Tax=Phyllosticta citriasiana TaxID=595635 RepID=UPI0030FDCD8F
MQPSQQTAQSVVHGVSHVCSYTFKQPFCAPRKRINAFPLARLSCVDSCCALRSLGAATGACLGIKVGMTGASDRLHGSTIRYRNAPHSRPLLFWVLLIIAVSMAHKAATLTACGLRICCRVQQQPCQPYLKSSWSLGQISHVRSYTLPSGGRPSARSVPSLRER